MENITGHTGLNNSSEEKAEGEALLKRQVALLEAEIEKLKQAALPGVEQPTPEQQELAAELLASNNTLLEQSLEYLEWADQNYKLAKNNSTQWLRCAFAIDDAKTTVHVMMGSKIFKLMHLWDRFKSQLIRGDMAEKKNFFRWLFSRNSASFGDSHQPIARILHILDKAPLHVPMDTPIDGLEIHLEKEKKRFVRGCRKPMSLKAATMRRVMDERSYKGILVYPHTVYWEPLQTPQQLLRAFAREGWLCFFCEHPNAEDNFGEVEPNLFITPELDFLQAVQHTQVTVMLTWMGSRAFVDQIGNKQIWYHILDKLDIFPCFGPQYTGMHNTAMQDAAIVSYVSRPLDIYVRQRPDSIYLPNGVMPEDLLEKINEPVPEDLRPILARGKKIIGYYGYLAEWMDYNLVAMAAKARPDYEFVFIGKAIHETGGIETIPNVHLLGLKPYKDLVRYARHFDVATIPFLVDNAMNCVSPIKFYEYCTLGLPVISSYMQEVEAFEGEFISCFKTGEEYLSLLDSFTRPEVKQAAAIGGPEIGKANTWDIRAQQVISLIEETRGAALFEPYKKHDVIVFSVIDYDFRHQRPQHFATQFARRGHRVFYINANHVGLNYVHKKADNLYIVNFHSDLFETIHLGDWIGQMDNLKILLDSLMQDYFIRDAIQLVDYPNWVHGAEYLREKYGFKIITDYMDDFTGFLNPAEELVRENCYELLRLSDGVVASSQFLHDIAVRYNANTTIVRNGTEYEHFIDAFCENTENQRPVIGYYGAVAEWFDAEKVCYLAKQMPECDVVIIGTVSSNQEMLSAYSNIKLLGEKAYSELPPYLAKFDVCLIPFDTSTDLIKATNPVKFYEYLSAGKKIVATEIPELEPFKDRYVYLSNDNRQFAEYVRTCIRGEDSLCSPEEAMELGKANDWLTRYELVEGFCKQAVPKASVVVLTYNNLEYNQLCVQSILDKTAYPNYELIIVDNASTDGTVEWLRELEAQKLPQVKIILSGENKGFAGGNNLGIESAAGDVIVLLNNDTIVTRGWLTSLVKHLDSNPKMGMCGSVTNSIGNEAKIQVNYNSLIGLDQFAFTYTKLNMGKLYPKEPAALAMFAVAIKREVVDKVGGLDEGYVRGMFEDDDYAQAVLQAGYHLAIAEDSFVHHFLSVSFNKLENADFMKIFDQNKLRYENKWGKKWVRHSYREGVFPDTNLDITLL